MSQPGHDPHGYNPMTNQRHYTGRNLYSYRCQYRHLQSIDQCLNQDTIYTATILRLISAIIQGAILLAIDVNTETAIK